MDQVATRQRWCQLSQEAREWLTKRGTSARKWNDRTSEIAEHAAREELESVRNATAEFIMGKAADHLTPNELVNQFQEPT